MPPQIHTLAPLPDASVCTEIFTYIIVVFFLVRLSIDELGPEARRRGCIPPSSIIYLACILAWPVAVGFFTFLLILGLLHVGLDKAYALGVRGAEACPFQSAGGSRTWRWATLYRVVW